MSADLTKVSTPELIAALAERKGAYMVTLPKLIYDDDEMMLRQLLAERDELPMDAPRSLTVEPAPARIIVIIDEDCK